MTPPMHWSQSMDRRCMGSVRPAQQMAAPPLRWAARSEWPVVEREHVAAGALEVPGRSGVDEVPGVELVPCARVAGSLLDCGLWLT